MKINPKFCIAIAVMILSFVSVSHAETILTLEWIAPVDGGQVDGYNLYYGLADDIDTMTKIEDISGTNYSLKELEMPNCYYFYVQAYNIFGEGPVSEVKVVNVSLRLGH